MCGNYTFGMHRLLSTVVVLAWGLWFGAIVMVFVTVTSLFSTFADQRQVAGAAAAGVFKRFEALELGAAAVALIAAVLVRRHVPTRAAITVISLLLAAALGAAYTGVVLTPELDSLRNSGPGTDSDRFRSLHGLSSAIYLVQAFLLLATGLFLPACLTRTDTSAAPPRE